MTTTRKLAQPLRGIVTPMVTPLTADDQLDVQGLERLIEHLVAGGVHGLFILGTCGEGPSLNPRLRRHVVDHVCRVVQGRIPVLVGISNTSYVESVELAGRAADAGADALVLAPPYYLPVSQTELQQYVLRLVRDVSLPLVLYNMPELTQVSFEPDTVRRLLQEERIIGLKDSSGDLDYFQKIRQITRERADWTLLMGPEHLLAKSIELGGDGGVSGGANVCPRLFVELFEAAVAKRKDDLACLVEKADRLGKIYQIGTPSAASVIKGLKSALSILNICDDFVAEPLERLSPAGREQVESILRALDIQAVNQGCSSTRHC